MSDGRVFVLDFAYARRPRGVERALALDERTGRILWSREWEADYTGLSYDTGPRATPTVDADRVYVLGAAGALLALHVKTGNVLWTKDYVKDYGGDTRAWAWNWGIASAPLVDGNRLIALVGGRPDAKVVAFDKLTGKEIWRALSGGVEPGYSQPIIVTAGGTRQLIVWHPEAISSIDQLLGRSTGSSPSRSATPLLLRHR